MALTKIATTDSIVAQGHPTRADIKNRAAQELHTKMLVEHDSNGAHTALQQACVLETGTLTGDGTAARDITLTNPALHPKFVVCTERPAGNLPADANYKEKVVNGGFDTDMAGWSTVYGNSASVAGGESGNCCQLTQGTTDGIVHGAFELAASITAWTVTSSGTGIGSAISGVAGGQSGNCCQISVTNTAGQATTISVTQTRSEWAGQPYKVTMYVKCTDAALIGQSFTVICGNTETAFGLPADWTQFTATGFFNAAGNCTVGFRFYTATEGAFSGILLDSVVGLVGVRLMPQDAIVTMPGRQYNIHFAIKAGTAGAGGVVYVALVGSTPLYGQTSLEVTADWTTQTISVPYFFATDTTQSFYFCITPVAAGTTLIDSVQITEAPVLPAIATDVTPLYPANPGSLITALADGVVSIRHLAEAPGGCNLNTDGIDMFYFIMGTVSTTYTGDPEVGTDPNWVEDGQQMLGGTVGTEPGNRVEQHIYDNFVVEHNDDGTHTTDPFAGFVRIETGSFVSTGYAQEIDLTLTTLVLKDVWMWSNGVSDLCRVTASMTPPNSKLDSAAAYVTNMITALGTGTFTVIGTPSATYYFVALGI